MGMFCLGSNEAPAAEKPAPAPQEQPPSTVETNQPAATSPAKPSSVKCTQEGFIGDPDDCRLNK